MSRVTQKLDLERVALDAYSVVWEPSRKQVRDHQRATKAAIAAVLLHLSDTWAAVPEYQTNGHVQQTVGEFGGRLLIAATDLLGAGEDDDLHALLSGEDRSEPTLAPREPRVWVEDDAEPDDKPPVSDCMNDVWTYNPDTGLWETPDTRPMPWHRVAKKYQPLTEVVTPEGPA